MSDDDDIGTALDLLKTVIDQEFGRGFAAANAQFVGLIYLAGSIERAAAKVADAIDRRDDGSYLEAGLKEAAGILVSREVAVL